MKKLLEYLLVGLDDDERCIFPEMYINNTELYDKIKGVAYLVRTDDPDSGLDWIWERSLERRKDKDDLEILAKVYIVRLRLPWNKIENECLITKEEFEKNRDAFELIDVYLNVRKKDNPDGPPISLVDPLEFESNRDDYEILEIKYLVSLRDNTAEEDSRFLDIPGDRFHTMIAE